jgi:hypothetical protein
LDLLRVIHVLKRHKIVVYCSVQVAKVCHYLKKKKKRCD